MEKTLYITSKKLMKHKVYVLLNEYGVVEYVGETKDTNARLARHKCNSKHSGSGKFHARNDIMLEVVKEFDNLSDALRYEGELKLSLGFIWDERKRSIKAGKITGRKNVESGQIYKLSEAARMPVNVYDARTNDFIGEFPSQIEFARLYNLHQAAVNRVVIGKQKTTGGFIIRKK